MDPQCLLRVPRFNALNYTKVTCLVTNVVVYIDCFSYILISKNLFFGKLFTIY